MLQGKSAMWYGENLSSLHFLLFRTLSIEVPLVIPSRMPIIINTPCNDIGVVFLTD